MSSHLASRSVTNAHAPRVGQYVLYLMTAARRPVHNFALQRAVELARACKQPLLVVEALRAGYAHANARHHAFVLQGMQVHAQAFARAGVTYAAYVEPEDGAGKGLFAALASDAAVVVGDRHPGGFHPRMEAALASICDGDGVRLEQVDGVGLVPIEAAGRAFARAVDFRRFVQRTLPEALSMLPAPEPLAGGGLTGATVAEHVRVRWPMWDPREATRDALARVAIDRSVSEVACEGGYVAARARLHAFVRAHLSTYGEGRNHPDADASSRLSPYLHFGMLSPHEILREIAERHDWTPASMALKPNGRRVGFWGLPEAAEAFMDQLVTWRELACNGAAYERETFAHYAGLPSWARATLDAHALDERAYIYTRDQLDAAATHDALWNAAQRQLVTTGSMHNYLRMLWGKKVLEWSPTPVHAFDTLVYLNDRYALDGRDPNSYAGIGWVFGRYDRPWAPERPIFGRVRFMSSVNTLRKLKVAEYLETFGAASGRGQTHLFM